ncbi:imidazole glycerol phosphate synthase subunit HisH [Qingshengfaniella alkalisoli]|uniref:Imidazole glycerol phosphate synthase subunit HisH n=1 Tax=Qingshengfaniella alkalisoli TaxID=2599296 RepID=A0A5B8J337_9RHOB|nr:imidazole glycerol phosphate synthase subunit HisH [Qingshengfaniella alkalisoli]QDY68690.1 imidazole glycerol phosphate synthase subunit HisH [Qingshengfaniella alkalisoli]
MTTVIVDYQSGNLHSAQKAFQRMAAETDAGDVIVTSSPDDVARADRIVLPGDGAFPACREGLASYDGLFEAMNEAVHKRGVPFLGICVGMQLLATWGREYRDTPGFDWIGGEVVKIEPDDASMKVPHMGWNELAFDNPHAILDGVEQGAHAYFVHSYHFRVDDPADRIAHVDYGTDITAIIAKGPVIGMQFHPEKSQSAGLRMIANFLTWTP